MYYNGMQVIESPSLVDTVQSRTHKKKRINKKWFKRYGQKSTPSKKIFIMNNQIFAHPTLVQIINNEIG